MKTDAKMKNEIMEELLWDATIKSRDIVVRAHQGVVTLSGTVSNYAEKTAAELAVQRVSGVKAIAEELEVHGIDGQLRSDSQVADAVSRTLAWHVWVPSHILATVENGWVTLTGQAKWEYERHSAEKAIEYLAGVNGVSNNIELNPVLVPSEVQHSIEAALKRNAQVNAQNITVTFEDGKVTVKWRRD